MRKKIVGILICMLLISSTTSLALTTFNRNEKELNNIFVDIKPIPLPTSNGWIKTLGGAKNESSGSVQQTTDGGYIITGSTESFGAGGWDVWLIKTDDNGNEEWNRTFGGTSYDHGNSVQQTTDNGYIISGRTYSYGAGGNDVWLIKTDENGDKLWDKTFGKIMPDIGYSVQQTTDGGYIIIGSTRSFGSGWFDVWLIKTDNNGEELWNRTFGGTSWDQGYSVKQTTDGGYIITGYTNSSGAGLDDIWLIKTDNNGEELWNRTFGGTSWDQGYSVKQTTDGGYIITGYTFISPEPGVGQNDVWLIKTDGNGNKLWDKKFGGTSSDEAYSVQQTNDGGYIISGFTWSHVGGGQGDVWLIKTDGNGNKQWDNTFGKILSHEKGYSVQQTTDGGYIITGYRESLSFVKNGYYTDILLIKTDSEGKPKTLSLGSLLFEKLSQRFPLIVKILNQIIL